VKPAIPANSIHALQCARQALSLMTEHQIAPTPVNYTLWYHYSCKDMPELTRELDALLGMKKGAISAEISEYLYGKHILAQTDESESVQQSSLDAQHVIANIMLIMQQYRGAADEYNEGLGQHIEGMASRLHNPVVAELVKELIGHTVAMRDSGKALSATLDEAHQEIERLKEHLENITQEANRDFLTGVSNRKAFDRQLDALAMSARQQNQIFSLLMLDIDHFKRINDTHGHPIGDEVLRQIGRILFERIRGKDMVARYGGEEFAILLPETPLQGGVAVAEHIRKNIASIELVRKDTGERLPPVTISIGVAQYRGSGDSLALLITRADQALYRSKLTGRDRVTAEAQD
jgi:diguanylate cyclase